MSGISLGRPSWTPSPVAKLSFFEERSACWLSTAGRSVDWQRDGNESGQEWPRRRLCASLGAGYEVAPASPAVCRASSGSCGQLADKALYDDFVDAAIEKVQQHANITPFLYQEQFDHMTAVDGTTRVRNFAFESQKMRLFRVAEIDGGDALQVLNVAIFPRPQYDLPIFCADFFSTSTRNIIVLDLNPLFDTRENKSYREKYFSELMPLGNRYAELLPWGDKLTSESLRFFSPIVIWTRPESRDVVKGAVFDAFQDYLEAYMTLVDTAIPATNEGEVLHNKEAQHRYLMWRATKDPGRPVLTRLYGERLCESYVKHFLFNGLDTLGSKSFLDYFPEYTDSTGCLSKQRSILGKSYPTRPWDRDGNFVQ